MIHEYFIEQHAKGKIDKQTHKEQVERTTEVLDQWVRLKFSSLNIKLDGSNESEIKQAIQLFSDRISMIVLFDVLKQQNIEAAANVFTFWLAVGIKAKKNKYNLHLEGLVIGGLSQCYLTKAFSPCKDKETGEYRPGYMLLNNEVKMQDIWKSLQDDKSRYSPRLTQQKNIFPPLNLFANQMFKAREMKDGEDIYNDLLNKMKNFQHMGINSKHQCSIDAIDSTFEFMGKKQLVKFSTLLDMLNSSMVTIHGDAMKSLSIEFGSDLDECLVKQSEIMATPLSPIDSKTELDLKQNEQKPKKLKKRLSTKSLPRFKKQPPEDFISGSQTERGYTKKEKTVDIRKVQSESVSGIQNDKLTDKGNQSDQIIRFASLGLSKEESTSSSPRSIPDSLFFSESLSFKEALSLSPMIEKIT
ncbi:hypothetical protein L3V86_09015 [Thiotrichales bacterium 19S11-10]|nr:hypothetical protein [Thiotrichales bacterium 19S11-10]